MSASPKDPHIETQRRAADGARLVLRGIALNAALAAIKIAGGVFGHAYVLIADGAESVLDIFASAAVWAGLRFAVRPPDANHPYGHGKAETLAALAVGLGIFATATWIGWGAVHKIMNPESGPHWATLPLLALVIVVKLWFSRRVKAAGKVAGSTALGVEAWHHWSDALTSAAAFVGITIAVVGGKGYETADGWAALAACGIIVFNGARVFRRALDEAMDIAAPPALEREIRAVALRVAEVRGLDKCRVRRSGLNLIVDIEIEVEGGLTVRRGHEIAHEVKDALLHARLAISDVSVHVEPAGG
ncbi:MAG TPA: cation diffusion facilitator family transporter [Opitutaceae bacterium]|nr:cation diffusion facilitator family transporter [Opitutaceae bacterium]